MEPEVVVIKKTNKGIVFLVTIVFIIILSACFYRIYDRVLRIDSNPSTTTTAPVQTEEEGFLYPNTIDYKLNDKIQKIKYKYYYHRCRDMECMENNKYYISVVTFINDQKVDNSETTIYYGEDKFLEAKDVTMDVKILFKLSADHLMTLKGADKDYLVLNLPYHDEKGQTSRPIIVNESGANIFEADIKSGTMITYKDAKVNNLYKNQFYIDQDKLYYLNYQDCAPYKYTVTVFADEFDRKSEKLTDKLINIAGEEC